MVSETAETRVEGQTNARGGAEAVSKPLPEPARATDERASSSEEQRRLLPEAISKIDSSSSDGDDTPRFVVGNKEADENKGSPVKSGPSVDDSVSSSCSETDSELEEDIKKLETKRSESGSPASNREYSYSPERPMTAGNSVVANGTGPSEKDNWTLPQKEEEVVTKKRKYRRHWKLPLEPGDTHSEIEMDSSSDEEQEGAQTAAELRQKELNAPARGGERSMSDTKADGEAAKVSDVKDGEDTAVVAEQDEAKEQVAGTMGANADADVSMSGDAQAETVVTKDVDMDFACDDKEGDQKGKKDDKTDGKDRRASRTRDRDRELKPRYSTKVSDYDLRHGARRGSYRDGSCDRDRDRDRRGSYRRGSDRHDRDRDRGRRGSDRYDYHRDRRRDSRKSRSRSRSRSPRDDRDRDRRRDTRTRDRDRDRRGTRARSRSRSKSRSKSKSRSPSASLPRKQGVTEVQKQKTIEEEEADAEIDEMEANLKRIDREQDAIKLIESDTKCFYVFFFESPASFPFSFEFRTIQNGKSINYNFINQFVFEKLCFSKIEPGYVTSCWPIKIQSS